jgi:hypothetical protein
MPIFGHRMLSSHQSTMRTWDAYGGDFVQGRGKLWPAQLRDSVLT